MSAIKGPLDKIGKYLDPLLNDTVTGLRSYVQDTRDILAKIKDLQVPKDAWLVGVDVEFLYTSIPHSCGMRAVSDFFT